MGEAYLRQGVVRFAVSFFFTVIGLSHFGAAAHHLGMVTVHMSKHDSMRYCWDKVVPLHDSYGLEVAICR